MATNIADFGGCEVHLRPRAEKRHRAGRTAAITSYIAQRGRLEEDYGLVVPRALETEVRHGIKMIMNGQT